LILALVMDLSVSKALRTEPYSVNHRSINGYYTQETIIPYLTPEGVPTDAPKNISWRFQTPDVVEIVYDPPPEHARNGQIVLYEIQFWKGADPNQKKLRSTTGRKAVFANLDDNTEYKFSVRGNTRKGYGPWSTQQTFRTDRNIVRAPLGVKAMATSDSSLEVSNNSLTKF